MTILLKTIVRDIPAIFMSITLTRQSSVLSKMLLNSKI